MPDLASIVLWIFVVEDGLKSHPEVYNFFKWLTLIVKSSSKLHTGVIDTQEALQSIKTQSYGV